MLIGVYTCQNVKLLEISCSGSFYDYSPLSGGLIRAMLHGHSRESLRSHAYHMTLKIRTDSLDLVMLLAHITGLPNRLMLKPW